MRNRGRNGQFIRFIEANDFDFMISIYRLIPIFIIFYILFKYYHVSEVIGKLLIDIACGPNCTCKCDLNGKTSWS